MFQFPELAGWSLRKFKWLYGQGSQVWLGSLCTVQRHLAKGVDED
jgi:hypothetical protein